MEKERFEWIHSWTDETNESKYKRVLLIGDSIFHGLNEILRGMLKGERYLDYISSSYTVDRDFYKNTMSSFANQYEYDLIIVNHALHGKYMSDEVYEENMIEFLGMLKCRNIVLAYGSVVYEEGLGSICKEWDETVKSRNASMEKLAAKLGLSTFDFYSVSKTVPLDSRIDDGFHYKKEGSEILAKSLAELIKAK
ncbi:MAG: SGNH/GDSL hydrolase family protein [Bacilli bacterium]|nr:SGNH/GDSL hydrolase family protein [Bacilli bacterium]